MEKRIMFCNIAWMKYYVGVTEDDKPINGGSYINDKGTGGEVNCFFDDNGKCYGFVNIQGDIALQDHYKGVKATDEYVDNVLVVWVATNKEKETRIVGWYINARVYRSHQESIFFTDLENNKYYNVVADAKDCYLLPVEDRTFPINRAKDAGKGTGFGQSNIWYAESPFAKANIVPAVIKYIEGYEGAFSNFVYDVSWDIDKEIENIEFLDDYKRLYDEGIKFFNEGNYYEALVYFKAAQRIDEPIELLKEIAITLRYLLRTDEAIEFYHKIISIEGEKEESLISLVEFYDWKGEREKVIEYANKLLNLFGTSPDDIENKRFIYAVLFNTYIYLNKFEKAEETMYDLKNHLEEVAKYSAGEVDIHINDMRNILKREQTNS